MTLSLKEDVKLRETENAWKPTRMKVPASNEDEAKTEVRVWNCSIVFEVHGRSVYKKYINTFSLRHLAILPL
jgi:hypothetical protein